MTRETLQELEAIPQDSPRSILYQSALSSDRATLTHQWLAGTLAERLEAATRFIRENPDDAQTLATTITTIDDEQGNPCAVVRGVCIERQNRPIS